MTNLIFNNARDAVAWAEEYATRPDFDSQLLVKSPSFGGMTPTELRDMALTITSITANCDMPKGVLFSYVYGSNRSRLSFADPIAHMIHSTLPGMGKPIATLRALAHANAESIRRNEQFGKPLSRRKIAKGAGIPFGSFSNQPWLMIDANCREILHRWLDMTEAMLNHEFEALGLF